jgi:arylsulfatase A-like enzyme
MRLGAALGVAAWLGLGAGLADLGLTVARAQLLQHGIFRKTPHLLWMIPASCLVVFLAVGLAVWVMVRPLGQPGRSVWAIVVTTLAVLAVAVAVPGVKAAACLVLALGVAAWVGPWAAARPAMVSRLVRWTLPVMVVVVLGLAGWSWGRPWLAERAAVARRPAAVAGAPDVFLLVMDTVRADATSLHGGAADLTPNLVRLADQGVVFERAIAPAPWTLPSHASLFTGLWPWQLEVGLDRPLPRTGPPTLAEWFAARGYATAGFVANTVFCAAEYGLARGFDHYEDHTVTPAELLRCSSLGWLLGHSVAGPLLDWVLPRLGRPPRHPFEASRRHKDATEINAAALRWLDAQEPDRPVFAFLNYMDAHDPYLPPPGVPMPRSRPTTLADYRLLRSWAELDKPRLDARQEAFLRAAYDDGIAYLDHQIGRLLEALEQRGRLRNAVVVVTSDHGEHFGEHASGAGDPVYGHGTTLYQAEVRVPLVVWGRGVPAGVRVKSPVSLRDLAATLIGLSGLGGAGLPGTSLAGLWQRDGGDDRGALAELALRSDLPPDLRYRVEHPALSRGVVAGDVSYHRIGQGREELYDLAADPDEVNNLAGEPSAQATLEAMRAVLEALGPPTATALDEPGPERGAVN